GGAERSVALGQPDVQYGQTMASVALSHHTGIYRSGVYAYHFHPVVLGLELKYRLLLGSVAIIAVAVVVHTFKYPDRMVSPGALIMAHQELGTDCFACHVPFLGVSSNRCISCHAVEHIGLRTTLGEIITEPKTEI